MAKSKVLILGSGGREHALCWHLKNSQIEVECAPGSDAISKICPIWNFAHFDELLLKIQAKGISEVIVGPEKYLDEGVADFLNPKGVNVFGPSKSAARLETDKAYAKAMMKKWGLPTARSETISTSTEFSSALSHFRSPYVVKASGLAAGKGVWIGNDADAARAFADEMLKTHSSVVLEEFLSGEEISYFVLIDGEKHIFFGAAQDHKRLSENDAGPNTGGMGAYSPVPLLTTELQDKIENQIVRPLVAGLQKEKMHYRGFLFIGLMIVKGEPLVLEFNCRMGDPETQALMLRLKTPLTDAIRGISQQSPVEFYSGVSLAVVVASKGYPDKPAKDFFLPGIETNPSGVTLFHSGTRYEKENWSAKGGRLFSAGTLEPTLSEAQQKIYSWLESLELKHVTYRRDVGAKAFRHLITGPIT